jgi:hypothetical protein
VSVVAPGAGFSLPGVSGREPEPVVGGVAFVGLVGWAF